MKKQNIYSFLLLIIFLNITTASFTLKAISDPINDPSKDTPDDFSDENEKNSPIDIFIESIIIIGIIGVPIFLLLATRPINKVKHEKLK